MVSFPLPGVRPNLISSGSGETFGGTMMRSRSLVPKISLKPQGELGLTSPRVLPAASPRPEMKTVPSMSPRTLAKKTKPLSAVTVRRTKSSSTYKNEGVVEAVGEAVSVTNAVNRISTASGAAVDGAREIPAATDAKPEVVMKQFLHPQSGSFRDFQRRRSKTVGSLDRLVQLETIEECSSGSSTPRDLCGIAPAESCHFSTDNRRDSLETVSARSASGDSEVREHALEPLRHQLAALEEQALASQKSLVTLHSETAELHERLQAVTCDIARLCVDHARNDTALADGATSNVLFLEQDSLSSQPQQSVEKGIKGGGKESGKGKRSAEAHEGEENANAHGLASLLKRVEALETSFSIALGGVTHLFDKDVGATGWPLCDLSKPACVDFAQADQQHMLGLLGRKLAEAVVPGDHLAEAVATANAAALEQRCDEFATETREKLLKVLRQEVSEISAPSSQLAEFAESCAEVNAVAVERCYEHVAIELAENRSASSIREADEKSVQEREINGQRLLEQCPAQICSTEVVGASVSAFHEEVRVELASVRAACAAEVEAAKRMVAEMRASISVGYDGTAAAQDHLPGRLQHLRSHRSGRVSLKPSEVEQCVGFFSELVRDQHEENVNGRRCELLEDRQKDCGFSDRPTVHGAELVDSIVSVSGFPTTAARSPFSVSPFG